MRLGFAVSACLWALFSCVVFFVAVFSPGGQEFEQRLLESASFNTSPPSPLGLVSEVSIAVSLGVICVVAFFAHSFARAIAIAGVSGFLIVLSQLLKNWLPRPQLVQWVDVGGEALRQNSFPSGHMMIVAVICAAGIWASPVFLRVWVAGVGAFLLALTGWQILQFGWHRPSDLFGSVAIVAAIMSVARFLTPGARLRGAGAPPAGLQRLVFRLLPLGGLLMVVAALGLLVWWKFGPRDDALFLLAAQLGVMGVCFYAIKSFMRL